MNSVWEKAASFFNQIVGGWYSVEQPVVNTMILVRQHVNDQVVEVEGWTSGSDWNNGEGPVLLKISEGHRWEVCLSL